MDHLLSLEDNSITYVYPDSHPGSMFGGRLMRERLLLAAGLAAAVLASCGDDDSVLGNEAPVTLQVEFQDLRVEEISAQRAVVRFSTTLPTTCEVEYGLTAADLDLSAQDPTMGPAGLFIDHEVSLEGLRPGTEYHFRARSTTAEGANFRSEVLTFTTLDAAADILQLLNVATIAQGASVTHVSSNFGGAANDQTWGAHNAVDGDMGTEWATDGDGDEASITIELTSEQTLRRFLFRSRKMPDGSSIITSVQLVVGQGTGRRTIGPFETPDPDVAYTFDLEPPLITRVVTVEAVTTTGGNTGAREIQLFVDGS